MIEQSPDAQPITEPKPATWLDLVLYIVGGFGLYVLASVGVDLFFEEISILTSVVLYLLNFFFLAGAVYVLGVCRGRITWEEMGFLPVKVEWWWLLIAAAASAILIPLRMVLGYLVLYLLEGGLQGIQDRADIISVGMRFSWMNFALTFLGAGLLAPISEELYFRGLLHGWFRSRRLAFWLRVLCSSTLFALAHFDSLAVVVSSFVLGVVNALFYEWSKSIWVAIAMHMLTNSVAVVLLYAALAVLEYFPMLGR
jgi:membrane protease YdiL (CAAX protease family)